MNERPDHIVACFAERVAEAPGAVAVVDEDGATSYAALAARADAVARHLLSEGLVAGQPVGVWMRRRAELVAVLLGVMKAGGAYVPCDPEDPPDRVRRMLDSCGSALVVGDPALLEALQAECVTAAGTSPRGLDPDTIPALPVGVAPVLCAEGGSRLAYLLFTSGSTGDPKAVEVEHRQVLALLRSACELLGFGPRDRYLAASTIAFDASITELFLPLVTGASLLLRDRGILLEPRRLAQEVRDCGVTVVQTGPSVWSVILAEVPDFPRVRVAITHGEAVSPELARRLCTYGEEVWNLYGPTETTVWATGFRLSPDAGATLSPMSAPIGRPLAHVRAHVVDEHGKAVPDGTEGELWLGGPSVARGYRDNDALTRERFVEFGGERVYRSGDVVVRDVHGVLHYFGRNDDQMKVRGIRVEPSEVEAAILRDSRVAHAAATWFPTPGGTRAIVAAVVLRPGVTCRAKDLHENLATRLPAPMIPARFVFLTDLPLTTSGKVDRKAIRQRASASGGEATPGLSNEGTQQQPPSRILTGTERVVSGVWRRLLGVESVEADDHFFTVGGDSLTAVQMMVELEGRFGLVLPVHLAFEAPTLETLSARIDAQLELSDDEIINDFVYPLVPSGSGPPMFFSGVDLSLARRGLWTVPCPLFAITNWAKGSGFVRMKSIEGVAASHLARVRGVQPHGPYRFGGYSLGGLIALEMAHQVRAAGEEVELLFLLDPMAPLAVVTPGAERAPALTRPSLAFRVARRVSRVAKGPGAAGWPRWFGLMAPVHLSEIVGWYRYLAVHYYLRHPNPVWRALFPANRWRAFWVAARRMVWWYSARPYDGRVLAVFCEQGERGQVWESLLGKEATRLSLDAPHLELFQEPAIGQWMKWLSEFVTDHGVQ
ncbi:MAG: amino acid adenylation domain-containing protein [Vicinamibacterales bacterium]